MHAPYIMVHVHVHILQCTCTCVCTVSIVQYIPAENMSPEKRGTGRGSGGTPRRSGGSNFTFNSCIDLNNKEGRREGGGGVRTEGGMEGGKRG